MAKRFVPENFQIPTVLENEKLRLRPLTVDDAEKDYDAVMSNIEHIRGIFGNNWPPKDLTYEEGVMGIKLHQKDMETRSSFAYAVMNLDETKYLGCVYIYPSSKVDYDAIVFFWVIKSELANGLDEFLFSTIKNWMQETWPFDKVSYLGREISWDEWESLK